MVKYRRYPCKNTSWGRNVCNCNLCFLTEKKKILEKAFYQPIKQEQQDISNWQDIWEFEKPIVNKGSLFLSVLSGWEESGEKKHSLRHPNSWASQNWQLDGGWIDPTDRPKHSSLPLGPRFTEHENKIALRGSQSTVRLEFRAAYQRWDSWELADWLTGR